MRSLMVTLAGLEPATSPAPENKDALSPLELQRRHDLHDRLWRRKGVGHRTVQWLCPSLFDADQCARKHEQITVGEPSLRIWNAFDARGRSPNA